MLYIVGGASRAGKTTVANKLLKTKQVSVISTDLLIIGFSEGLPQVGIEGTLSGEEKARRIWPYLKAICACILEDELDYVVEGEAILPEYVHELCLNDPNNVKACFIGFSEHDPDEKFREVRTYSQGKSDWTTTVEDETIHAHLVHSIAYSKYLRAECLKYGLPYFESTSDFNGENDRALAYLTGE